MSCPTCQKQPVGPLRNACALCTCKHLGAAITAWDMIAAPASVLAERSLILIGESVNGYPLHKWLAVGGVALIVQQAAVEGKIELSHLIHDQQKLIEAGEPLPVDFATTLRALCEQVGIIKGGKTVAAAHLCEAATECPNKSLRAEYMKLTGLYIPPFMKLLEENNELLTAEITDSNLH